MSHVTREFHLWHRQTDRCRMSQTSNFQYISLLLYDFELWEDDVQRSLILCGSEAGGLEIDFFSMIEK